MADQRLSARRTLSRRAHRQRLRRARLRAGRPRRRCAASPSRTTRSCPAIPTPMSALHALTDALLATCGAGDIGTHFPPSDPQWRGAASRIFVEHAAKLVRERGGRIANADITLICRGAEGRPAPRGDGRGAGGDARNRRRARLGQGDDQRKARLRRPRGRHRRDRDRDAWSIPGGCRNERRRPTSTRWPAAVLDACRRRGIMLATAESCTGGMIVAALTDIPGSSAVVDRGFVTYSNEAKIEMLGVSAGDARRAWRGVARDGAGDGGRRAGPFARRHRAGGHRHRRAGRRLGRKAGRPGLVRRRDDRPRAASPRRRLFDDRGRDYIRRQTVRHGAGDWRCAALGDSGAPARRRSRRRASRRRRRTCGRRGRTSSPSARRGCGS